MTTKLLGSSGGGIKSIQRGIISIVNLDATADAIVSAVDTSKSTLSYLGTSSINTNPEDIAYVELVDATTVRATRRVANTGTTFLSWELIEYA